VHDIIFTFNDSCNCPSLCCKPRISEEVYINSNGVLETFKERKAREDIENAFARSVMHLQETLERNVAIFNGDPKVFQFRIHKILESINLLKIINLNHIEAINELLLQYMQEKIPETAILKIEEIKRPQVASCEIL